MVIPQNGRFVIKRHATRPYLRLLVKQSNGTPFDFTGATGVTIQMRDSGGTLKVSSAAEIESPATSGVLRYKWEPDDTDTAGEFVAEFDVAYPAGELLTVPLDGNITVKIYEDVNDA